MADKEFTVRHGLVVANNILVVSNNKVAINGASATVTLEVNSTDAILFPSGNTGQRPTGVNGYIRYNSESSSFEAYANGGWGGLGGSSGVAGPGSTTNNAIVVWDSTAGALIRNSLVTINANGRITTVASNTTAAGINLPHGAAPTSPTDGDVWTTNQALFVRINGTTIRHVNRAGDSLTGRLSSASGTTTGNSAMATANTGYGEFEVIGNGTGAAMISFNRAGSYEAYFGLDTDNVFKVGGSSLGANAYKVWHAGNDGTGSTLDADLLDGQEGSYYLAAANAALYAPLTGATFTGNLYSNGAVLGIRNADPNFMIMDTNATTDNKIWVTKASGTTLDYTIADDTFAVIPATPYLRVTRNAVNTSLINIAFTSNTFTINGGTAWHSGNDGSGSGLDADLLDGQHGSYYWSTANRDTAAELLWTTKAAGASGNANNFITGGTYFFDTSATNVPTAGQQYWVEIFEYPTSNQYICQVAYDLDRSNLYWRTSQANTFSSWSNIWHDGYSNATNISTGTVPTARLGTGTANSSTYLRGDQTWAAASGTLEFIGSTVVSSAVATIEHTFTTGRYSSIIVYFCGISCSAAGSVALGVTLRTSGASLIDGTSGGGWNSTAAADGFTGKVEFIINTETSTDTFASESWGSANNTGSPVTTGVLYKAAGGNSVPDRIRVAWASGNIDNGTVYVYGVKNS